MIPLNNYHVFNSRVENIKDPDQLASQKAADLDLHSYFKTGYISVQHVRVIN